VFIKQPLYHLSHSSNPQNCFNHLTTNWKYSYYKPGARIKDNMV
jgi:hypothetical protein